MGQRAGSGQSSFSTPAVSIRASRSRTGGPFDQRVRRDLGERHQHEGTVVGARPVAVGDHVDIDGARPGGDFAGAVAAEVSLDPAAGGGELGPREARVQRDREVDEPVLLPPARPARCDSRTSGR